MVDAMSDCNHPSPTSTTSTAFEKINNHQTLQINKKNKAMKREKKHMRCLTKVEQCRREQFSFSLRLSISIVCLHFDRAMCL